MMRLVANNKLKILLAAGVVGLVGCSENKQVTQAAPERVEGVEITEIRDATVPDFVEVTGTVRSALSAQLASQVMGTIRRVNAREGDHVRRGEMLVSIDEAQQQAAYAEAKASLQASQESIAAAEADYVLAETTLKRYQMLYDKSSLSPQEYDEVKTRLTSAVARRGAAHANLTQSQARVIEARTAMDFTRVLAPFDGVVTSKFAEPGAMAMPGVPMLIVEDPSRFRLEVQVDESQITAAKFGEPVSTTIDGLGSQPIQGKVTQIVPAADPASRTFTVKIDLPSNPQIRSGLFGRARFPRGQRGAIEIPEDAVLKRGQLQAVYVVDSERRASLRFVTLGSVSDGRVEVLSGLQSGDRIVKQPRDRELSGKQVEAQ